MVVDIIIFRLFFLARKKKVLRPLEGEIAVGEGRRMRAGKRKKNVRFSTKTNQKGNVNECNAVWGCARNENAGKAGVRREEERTMGRNTSANGKTGTP